ncbi:MAG TPA: PEGA domain-containing protein [Candidatus Saccharimonadales bacterium]|nr:PEGA domain-containing protein [Candidatus Saccharimonadales bacterium]
MDYLDPKKQFRHKIILLVGYVLVGLAIVIGTLVLLYQAYGFGLGKNGTVIQNGLFFFSSQPHPANIYVNGTLKSVKTNTRLSLPAGIYHITLSRDGYRDWQREIALDGGSVEHFDYPFLIPKTLSPKRVTAYNAAPGTMLQSPDRRWLLVQQPGTLTQFDVYDLKNPDKAPTQLGLPDNLLTKAANPASESWQLGEWADDNQHVLLQHLYDGKSEYVLLDRSDPTQSVNLDAALNLSPTDPIRLTLDNKKYNQYYVYRAATAQLQKTTLKDAAAGAAAQPFLEHVLSYQSYSDDTMLYVTDNGAPAGKVLLKLRVGSKTYTIHNFPAGSPYLVDLTEYSGDLYVTASAANENKVYIYKDPIGQLTANPGRLPAPIQVLHVTAPNYLSFSDSAQFIVAENGTEFGVYDIENEQAYHYTSSHPLDAPQPHATWMDGDRLMYVSGGKLLMFDYDNANQQVLVNADSRFEPAFTPDFKFLYNLAPAPAAGQVDLDRTSLLTPADQ